ncbi:hypothetical protein VTO73DRAFT_7211 [Trametes versicolor]
MAQLPLQGESHQRRVPDAKQGDHRLYLPRRRSERRILYGVRTPSNYDDSKLPALQHTMLTIIASGDVRDCFLAADLGDTRPSGKSVSALRRSVFLLAAQAPLLLRLDPGPRRRLDLGERRDERPRRLSRLLTSPSLHLSLSTSPPLSIYPFLLLFCLPPTSCFPTIPQKLVYQVIYVTKSLLATFHSSTTSASGLGA